MKLISISATINGRAVGPVDVPDSLSANDFLREYAGLTGTKFGCGVGECGACVVMVEADQGPPDTIRTCITGADFLNGKRIRTIEGQASDGALSPLQQAFLDHFSFQCGYCTSGFLNAAQALLDRLVTAPVPKGEVEATILQAMDGHICRCTGYVRYYAAIRDVILSDPRMTR